ncbi:MAG TPA: ImmA/IrrE family metallo-endopeptidase [Candidatus Scybalocola faecavium]|nr:ImmA/IrrE family metallo-endopeptidase [Candidatus Scybalocola faecavium]
MPAVNVKISPEIITWALSQTSKEKLGEKLMNNITKWLNGTKTPTFNQIEDFSRKANIPLGYFFLQTPPVEKLDLLEYRTIDSIQLANPSRNLIDTVHEMENIQDWMKAYRQDLGFDRLSVVGCMSGVKDVNRIVDRIRHDLDISKTWFETTKDSRDAFGYIRKQLEECGVVVMMSGIAGKNTHRALDINEFRAFTMVDDWAPLIFINAADSNGAKLFSLLHELTHIWLGKSDLFNDRQGRSKDVSDIEIICNAVAGELLVPKDVFLENWNERKTDIYIRIAELARTFRCGEIVIARKAMDCKKIDGKIYDQVVQTAIENYNQVKKNKDASGGNYYNTIGSRLDGCFVRALCESINMGRTTYTEAYHLTNTNRKTLANQTPGSQIPPGV